MSTTILAQGLTVLALSAMLILAACVPKPYMVCSEHRCTKPLTHEDTVQAAEVKKAWGESASLHVEVAP